MYRPGGAAMRDGPWVVLYGDRSLATALVGLVTAPLSLHLACKCGGTGCHPDERRGFCWRLLSSSCLGFILLSLSCADMTGTGLFLDFVL